MEKIDLSTLRIEKSEKFKRSGKKKTRIALFTVALVISAILLFILLKRPVEVEVSNVSIYYPFQAQAVLNASGYVVAEKKAAVGVKTTGTLEWLGVHEGSIVKKGELIGRLENRDLEASLEQARANLELQEANLKQAEAELMDAGLVHERNRQLLEKGFISQQEYDTSLTRLKKAEALVMSQRAALRLAEAQVRAAEIALGYTYIRAPFDGIVLTKDADVGDIVTPLGAATNARASIVTIADLKSIYVEADVSEQNIGKVREGQECVIELDAFPERRFRGRVSKIIPTADRTKASVKIKVSFIERAEGILPDMSAKVLFLDRSVKRDDLNPVVVIPPSAIKERAQGAIVFVVEDGRIKERNVRAGRRFNDSLIEILEGLKPGERIVLRPTDKLKEGLKVKPKE